MNTPQEIDLIQSAIRSNKEWMDCLPRVKEHLFGSDFDILKGDGSGVLAQLKKEYFADRTADYPAFLADILSHYKDLYFDSLPCVNLCDEKALAEHQEAVKHFRTIDKYLVDKGDIDFNFLIGGKEINVLLVRVWDNEHKEYVEWETGKVWKNENTGAISLEVSPWINKCIGNVPINSIKKDSPQYNDIRNALRKELAIIIGNGYATRGHYLHDFAELCKPLDAVIKTHLPDTTNIERARVILQLFDIDADAKKFAEILNHKTKE